MEIDPFLVWLDENPCPPPGEEVFFWVFKAALAAQHYDPSNTAADVAIWSKATQEISIQRVDAIIRVAKTIREDRVVFRQLCKLLCEEGGTK